MAAKKKKQKPVELPVANGQVIAGRYVVSGVIGRGGMGVVLAGRHLELGERVAIKFLHKEHAAHADRFFREARAAAKIRTEHVVRIYDVGRLNTGEPYIVMEHLEGEDLDARAERIGRLDVRAVADILLEVCHALAEAHAAGIVHRDLKPANIFLAKTPGRDDLVKLLDFGVAKMPDGGAITKTASVLGSPIYMSPEQLMATRDVDARSDIWSLAIILYQLLTGEYPFEGDSLVHLAMVIREKETPSVRALRPDVPEGIDAVIAKCLQKDRNDRYRDVGEFARALAEFASPSVSHSISRISRIVAEKKERLALASTESDDPTTSISEEYDDDENDDDDDDDDEGLASTAHVPSGRASEDAISTRHEGQARRSGASSASGSSSPLTASLAAVSTSGASPLVDVQKRRARVMRLAVVGTALLGLGLVAKLAFFSAKDPLSEPKTAASLVSEAASLPVTTAAAATSSVPDAATPETVASVIPAVSPTSPVAVAPPRPMPAPLPAPVRVPKPAPSAKPASAPAANTANCTPPYTIAPDGTKSPKPECM